jgi:hypothetical protein
MFTARVIGLFRLVADTYLLQVTGKIPHAVGQFGLKDIGDNKKGGIYLPPFLLENVFVTQLLLLPESSVLVVCFRIMASLMYLTGALP